ncbi:hypothetical protein K4K61_003988 [Colletotrichum sp. SAR11_59]|nr:hypothetical protein K4K61_003988 [Colletotrichum sp. SAR11_59]
MFSTCLKSLRFLYLPPLPDEEDQNHKFEHYAAKNWPIYYELLDEDEKAKYDDQVRLLCDTTQPGTAKWLSFNGVFQRLETLKQLQAENFDSSSLAALFGFGRLVKKVKQADVLDSVQAKDNKVSPLQAASWNGKLDIVKELIRNKADIDYDTINIGSPIECAVRNAHVEVVEFLLMCTPAPVIRKETLESASRSHLSKSLLELISQRDPGLEVSEMLFKVAVENRSSGGDALESLLHDHPDLKPSDNTIIMAVRNESCNPKVLKILFDRHDDLRVTEEMVEEASLRWTDGSEVLLLLFDSSPEVNVTDDALVMAAGNANNGVAIMKLFLEKRPGLNIPQKAFRAAAENIISSTEMLRILFESRNGEQVTSDLIMGAMNNSKQGQATLDFLASQDGFNITQTCVETWFQTEQKFSFYENIAQAMRLGGDAITITEPMMKKIISWDLNYTDAFLRTIGSDFAIPITDDIYKESYHSCLVSRDRRKGANRGYQHFKTMKLLMGAQRRDIRIKGDDGNWLTEEEVMNKLDSWERELDEFFK